MAKADFGLTADFADGANEPGRPCQAASTIFNARTPRRKVAEIESGCQ